MSTGPVTPSPTPAPTPNRFILNFFKAIITSPTSQQLWTLVLQGLISGLLKTSPISPAVAALQDAHQDAEATETPFWDFLESVISGPYGQEIEAMLLAKLQALLNVTPSTAIIAASVGDSSTDSSLSDLLNSVVTTVTSYGQAATQAATDQATEAQYATAVANDAASVQTAQTAALNALSALQSAVSAQTTPSMSDLLNSVVTTVGNYGQAVSQAATDQNLWTQASAAVANDATAVRSTQAAAQSALAALQAAI